MKYILSILIICSPMLSFAEKTDTIVESNKDTVEGCAKDFFDLVMSPSSLTLAIKDDASLAKAKAQLVENKKSITILLKKLQTLPVPSLEVKKRIEIDMSKREAKMKEEDMDKFMKHFGLLTEDQLKEWKPALNDFYKTIGENKHILDKYFSADGKKAK